MFLLFASFQLFHFFLIQSNNITLIISIGYHTLSWSWFCSQSHHINLWKLDQPTIWTHMLCLLCCLLTEWQKEKCFLSLNCSTHAIWDITTKALGWNIDQYNYSLRQLNKTSLNRLLFILLHMGQKNMFFMKLVACTKMW